MKKTISCVVAAALSLAGGMASAQQEFAITNVSLIDGNGGQSQSGMTVIVRAGKITEIESSGRIEVPDDMLLIRGDGKFLLPGFIDSNVHASIYGNSRRRETVVRYGARNEDLALEFSQRQLMHGVTTVRDSYGALVPLMSVRDRIARGEVAGARMLVAGNIVGWGGPFSMTFSLMQESELTLFQAEWNDWIAQDVGEEMMDMGPEEVRAAINRYLDKGPDFIKYGGTSHFRVPSLIGFSPRVQKVIVDETHKRGLIAETHATSPEALRMAVEAGIDLIQHPEILSREYPDDLIDLIVERGVLCGVRSNTLTGRWWQEHLSRKAEVEESLRGAPEAKTSAERRQREDSLNLHYEIQRRNAERLIEAGCRVTIATDNYQGRAPEFRKEPKPEEQEAGIGSIIAIEGLVELGMTEMQAIVAATRNGAMAAGRLASLGTIEVGKNADLLLLTENPLDDIRNIRSLEHVFAQGRLIDLGVLPGKRVFFHGQGRTSAEIVLDSSVVPATMPIATATIVATATDEPQVAADRPESAETENQAADTFGSDIPVASISETQRGGLIVELENGQVWRQLNSDNTPVVLPADRTTLTADLNKSFLGSVTLRIEGTARSFKVRRIR